MLVLTRKLQEKIRIGDQVTITVLRMKGKAVRLGIEAPMDVPVIRGELVFEQTPEAVVPVAEAGETVALEGAAVAGNVATNGTADGRKDRAAADWPRDTRPHLPTDRVRGEEAKSEVRFARVPREKAAQFLGRTSSGTGGPLRSLLDERSKAV